MVERANPSKVDAASDTMVVLLLPEVLGEITEAQLRATLVDPSRKIRALILLPDEKGSFLPGMVSGLGVPTEVLLGPEVATPPPGGFVVRAFPATTQRDLTELALALSDVVLASSVPAASGFALAVAALGKRTVAPGSALPALPPSINIDRGLDPDVPMLLRRCARWLWGRTEQGFLELFAFNWRGRKERGIVRSLQALGKCAGWSWRPRPYFAPASWSTSVPDQSVRDPSSRMVACFNLLDRCASYGSYIHRDLVWLEHLGAAFAVFVAVFGYLTTAHPGVPGMHLLGWKEMELRGLGSVELLILVVIALMVVEARRAVLHEHWTACRLAAEQLRIALMSMPLLVLPSALTIADASPVGESNIKYAQFGFRALSEVKRIVRDHGLPWLDPALTPAQGANWLQLIVDDQIDYHRKNHHKLKKAEHRMRRLTQLIFLLAVAAVVAHFAVASKWLLLGTAAAPAFAAAFHAISTRLGIADRAELSAAMEDELGALGKRIADIKTLPPDQQAWLKLRRLAFEAAEAMGRENTSWHSLVRRYPHELP